MSAWRLAESLKKLREQINAAYPNRSKASDGSIGDAAHASRASDHNPWVRDGNMGIVTAIDITHDPAGGCNAEKLAQSLVASRDSRIKYLIWNKRMVSSYAAHGVPAWTWRRYSGSNPHTKHLHISVHPGKVHYDSTLPWSIGVDADTVTTARTHTVEQGETLSSIAARYLGSPALYKRIQDANNLTSTTIRVGQVLIIP